MSRHIDGTPFAPTTLSRDLWSGRSVYLGPAVDDVLLDEALEIGGAEAQLARCQKYIVLAVEGETAWLWRDTAPSAEIIRVDGHKRMALVSGEKKKHSLDRRGYLRVFLGLRHPLANSGGWQYVHRLAMVPFLGRLPTSREVVEHRRRERVQGEPFHSVPSNLLKESLPASARRKAGTQLRVPAGAPEGGRFVPGYRLPAAAPTQGDQRGLWS